MRIIGFIISALLTAALVFALDHRWGAVPPMGAFFDPFHGFWANAEDERNMEDIDLSLLGLHGTATVYYDERLVPHIFASNDTDLYYLQGYITARHRLWQMEIQTHNAAGRITEIAGDKALSLDRMQRRIGLGYGAAQSVATIDKDDTTAPLIRAYCAGVNAYISHLKPQDYPIEYKLIGYAPEEWTTLKVALLLKNMANMLSVYEYDIENTNFIAKYGQEQFSYLFPEVDSFQDFVIPRGTRWGFMPDSVNGFNGAVPDEKPLIDSITDMREAYHHIIDKPNDLNGSNNWAVAGSKTKSGKPMLCNDPHLELKLPSIWYEMHLVSPSMNVYGATLPGAPCVISGFNDSIAWGVTNGGRDVRDWYRIQFRNETHDEYLVDGQWVKTDKHYEHHKIRGGGEYIDTVLYTRYGPVVYDHSFGDVKSKQYLALKWTAHQGSNEMKTFLKLNRGKNYNDYINAIEHYSCPTQNFVFASRSGDIAIKQQGSHPITHSTVTDGRLSSNDWTRYIPAENNPHVKNPERGFVSSANQFPVDETYPYPISRVGIYEDFRAMRINRMLERSTLMDAAYMMQMQRDNYGTEASLTLPTLLRLVDRTKLKSDERSVLDTLDHWDYYYHARGIAPIYYEAWEKVLDTLLWDEMLDPTAPMRLPNRYRRADFLLHDSTSPLYDYHETESIETREMIVQMSFDQAMKRLRAKYGKITDLPDWGHHKATMIHHLSPSLDAFSRMDVYTGGYRAIVNATSERHGPSWRMIVDFGEMRGYCIFPGGESGNPGSRYYDNMIDQWAKGEYYIARFETRDGLDKKHLYKITAHP